MPGWWRPSSQGHCGQNCILECRAGAGDVIGRPEMLRAVPDGPTLLLGDSG
jgi:hypothetical protein